jgi:multidrug transporter EmrE-like cation transporter
MKYIFLSLSVLFNTGACMIFKSIAGKQNNLFWYAIFSVGLIVGAINTFFFTKSLKDIDLGIAYPVCSAASMAFIALASVFIFNEKFDLVNIIGVFVIILGIILLTR